MQYVITQMSFLQWLVKRTVRQHLLTQTIEMLTYFFVYHVQVITDYIYQLLEEEVKLKKHDIPVSTCKSLDILNVNLSVEY